MEIYRDVSPSGEYCGINTAVTLGTFDGVHVGHQQIIGNVIRKARKADISAAVVTFDRHPLSVLNPDIPPKMLTTLDEKLSLLEKTGIDATFVLSFTREISEITAEEFIEKYLLNCLGMKYFVVGYDHGFGKNRLSSPSQLSDFAKRRGFQLDIQEPVTIDDIPVKSSAIRDLISSGNISQANILLGRRYSVAGTVKHGKGLGTKLGFPTANIFPDVPEKILPPVGVYIGKVHWDGSEHNAAICVCSRTSHIGDETIIEAFLPGFKGDMYGQSLNVSFERRLRDLVAFDSTDDLVRQISHDVEQLTKS